MENGHDPWHAFGGGGVEPYELSVGLIGEHRFGDERVGWDPVGRILSGAGYLVGSIETPWRGADAHRSSPATLATAASMAR